MSCTEKTKKNRRSLNSKNTARDWQIYCKSKKKTYPFRKREFFLSRFSAESDLMFSFCESCVEFFGVQFVKPLISSREFQSLDLEKTNWFLLWVSFFFSIIKEFFLLKKLDNLFEFCFLISTNLAINSLWISLKWVWKNHRLLNGHKSPITDEFSWTLADWKICAKFFKAGKWNMTRARKSWGLNRSQSTV